MFISGSLSLLEYKMREEVVFVLHTIHMTLFEHLSSVEALVENALKDSMFRPYNTRSLRRKTNARSDEGMYGVREQPFSYSPVYTNLL